MMTETLTDQILKLNEFLGENPSMSERVHKLKNRIQKSMLKLHVLKEKSRKFQEYLRENSF